MSSSTRYKTDRPRPLLYLSCTFNCVAVTPICCACIFRSLGWHGRALTDAELEWAVLCLEEIEARMSTLEFSAAAGILESVLER